MAIDFVLVFALIWASTFAVAGPTAASPASSYVLLSLAAAAVAALDLAFWRHLRRAYASPRRGRRRG